MPRTETRYQPDWPPAMRKTTFKRFFWVCCQCGDGPHSPELQLSCPFCGARRCNYCGVEESGATEDITARENIGNGQAGGGKLAIDERPSPLADETTGFQDPSTPSRPEIVSKSPAFPFLGSVASRESQQVAAAGFSTESCAPITDSGYASAVNVLFPCAQPGSSNGKSSPPGKRAKVRRACEPRKSVLACPFWKAEPKKYCSCFDRLLNRISAVKQHLARAHTPKLYCERCSMIFSTEESRQQHVSSPVGPFCVPSTQLEGISHHQRIQIHRKSNRNLSQEEQWFVLWDIVFPDRVRPSSAYRTSGISEDLCSFRDYYATHGDTIVDAEVQERVDSGQLVLGGEMRVAIQRLTRNVFETAFLDFISTRPSSNAAGQGGSRVGSAQDESLATSSLPDSGVPMGTEPPASESRQNATLQSRGGVRVGDGSSSQREAGVEGAPAPPLEILPDSLPGDAHSVLQLDFTLGEEKWDHQLWDASYDDWFKIPD